MSDTTPQTTEPDLSGRVALVAGATRGAGRAIATELGAAGATVWLTGRSSRTTGPSDLGRSETIEGTAERVGAAGGRAVARRVDHSDPDQVAALVDELAEAHDGQLDVLVNDVWGGEQLVQFDTPFWELDLGRSLKLLRRAIETHLITSRFAVPLMVARRRGLVVEVTDGDDLRYRGNLPYDLAKTTVMRLAVGQAAELRPHGVTAVSITPGFLRSEEMLDHFGITEETWWSIVAEAPPGDGPVPWDQLERWSFGESETPHYVGRAIAALAADPDVHALTGQALASWTLMHRYGFTDLDGSQPDFGAFFAEHLAARIDTSDGVMTLGPGHDG